jgi:hypothetical protein
VVQADRPAQLCAPRVRLDGPLGGPSFFVAAVRLRTGAGAREGANDEAIEWLVANWNRREHGMDDRRHALAA